MLEQELALVPVIGSDEGVQDELVERVVDLRDPRQGRGSTVGGEHLAERGNRIWRIGQAQRRAIDGAHLETAPALDWSIMVPAPHEMAVQFDERAGLELLAGRTERTLGDRPLGHVGAVQDLKELIQFPLQRAFDQVDQEDEHDGKRQSAMTGEVCFGASMSGNEGRIVDELTDQSNYIIINVAGIPRSCLP